MWRRVRKMSLRHKGIYKEAAKIKTVKHEGAQIVPSPPHVLCYILLSCVLTFRHTF